MSSTASPCLAAQLFYKLITKTGNTSNISQSCVTTNFIMFETIVGNQKTSKDYGPGNFRPLQSEASALQVGFREVLRQAGNGLIIIIIYYNILL